MGFMSWKHVSCREDQEREDGEKGVHRLEAPLFVEVADSVGHTYDPIA